MFHVKHWLLRALEMTDPTMSALRDLRAIAEEVGQPIGEEGADTLAQWAELVITWRVAAQLTGVRTVEAVIRELMAPALYALSVVETGPQVHIVDFGCGNGCTGISLAIAAGLGHWSLVDRDTKKLTFCRYALSRCGIGGVEVLSPEEVGCRGRGADAVLARALPRDGRAIAGAAQLLHDDGWIVRWVGGDEPTGVARTRRCGDAALWVVAEPKGCFT